MDFPDVPDDVLAPARSVCLALPEAEEKQTGLGIDFKVRRRTFASVFAIEDPAGREFSMVVCRSDPEEREVLLAIGHPFFAPRSGMDRLGVVIEDGADWTELAELITESYRLLAPKKLASLLDEPAAPGEWEPEG